MYLLPEWLPHNECVPSFSNGSEETKISVEITQYNSKAMQKLDDSILLLLVDVGFGSVLTVESRWQLWPVL